MRYLCTQKDHGYRDSTNPLRGLNMPRLVSLQEAGERGEYADLMWFYYYMERSDAMIHSVIQRRRAALLARDWDVRVVSQSKDDPLALEQAEFLCMVYDNIENFREAALTGMGIMLVGAISIIWLLNPVLPWLVICVWILSTIGSRCSDLMYGSMVADICDEDELKTGERREGSYAAAGSFLGKTMGVLVLLLGGFMPRLAGYTDPSIAPTMEQLLRMKTLLIVTDVVGIALAMALLWFYPLTRKRTEATRRKLDERQNTSV